MEFGFNLTLIALLVAAVVSYAATPLVIKFANKFGIVDDPSKNKHAKVTHKRPTPRGGGLAIFTGFIVATFIFLPPDKHLAGIVIGASLVVLIGFSLWARFDRGVGTNVSGGGHVSTGGLVYLSMFAAQILVIFIILVAFSCPLVLRS